MRLGFPVRRMTLCQLLEQGLSGVRSRGLPRRRCGRGRSPAARRRRARRGRGPGQVAARRPLAFSTAPFCHDATRRRTTSSSRRRSRAAHARRTRCRCRSDRGAQSRVEPSDTASSPPRSRRRLPSRPRPAQPRLALLRTSTAASACSRVAFPVPPRRLGHRQGRSWMELARRSWCAAASPSSAAPRAPAQQQLPELLGLLPGA